MANIQKIKHTLMWRGLRELPARRLAEEIGANLDNYAARLDGANNLRKQADMVYDNHTRSIGRVENPTQTINRLRAEAK